MVRPSGDCVGPTTNVPAYANGGLTGVDHGIRWSNRVNWHLVRKSTHAPKEFIRTISTNGVNACTYGAHPGNANWVFSAPIRYLVP